MSTGNADFNLTTSGDLTVVGEANFTLGAAEPEEVVYVLGFRTYPTNTSLRFLMHDSFDLDIQKHPN